LAIGDTDFIRDISEIRGYYFKGGGMMKSESFYKSAAGEKEIMALYDAVLARWPVAHEDIHLPTRHGDTFIIASGKNTAPPLILLHGAASNAVSWVGDVAQYSAQFRVYAVDLLGEPGKSAPNRPAWDGPGYAEWLEDILNGLKIHKASLLGISQGGWTALRFSTSYPERVKKLALLTPGGVMPTRRSFLLKAILFSMFGRWGGKRINRMVFGKQAIHPEAVKFMDAIMTHFKARIGKEYIFSDEELKRLEMPVLVIGGTEDMLFPTEGVVRRLQQLLPRLEAELIPGMGHALVNMNERVIPFLVKQG
jgi:pimeloyl-ACP methyl ester carboxylesterase